MFDSLVKKYGDMKYAGFRIIIGYLFLLHGGMKIFGWFGGMGGNGAINPFSFPGGISGLLELIIGLLVLLGLFTRLAASLGAVEMLIAYIMAHAKAANWFAPLINNGEPAVLFMMAFSIIAVYGAGKKWSLEKVLMKKETF